MKVPDSPVKEIDAIRQQLMEMSKEHGAEVALEAALDLMLAARDHADFLAVELIRILRERVGRRSEKVDNEQLQLHLDHAEDDEVIDDAASADELEAELAAQQKTRKDEPAHPAKRGRKKLPEHLDRVPIEHGIPEDDRRCDSCDEPMPIPLPLPLPIAD